MITTAHMHAAGRAMRARITRAANGLQPDCNTLAQHLHRAGQSVRLVIADNAAASSIHHSSIHHSSFIIRHSLLTDIEPVLSALRAIIETPTPQALLTLAANLPAIERAVLENETADAAWLDFLTAAFITGLDLKPGTGNPEPGTVTAFNAIDITATRRVSQAFALADQRGILPTHLDTAGLRELDSALRARSFFSARTTSAGYVEALNKLVQRHIKGEGYDNDLPQLRVEAREMLRDFGYTPEQGFPGDAALGIPSAEPGTLRDLASERRLNLIFNTQAALMRGLGQKLRGLDRIDTHPAWELIRVAPRKAPRDWPKRWIEGGAELIDTRMIAPKDAEIWSVLGDSAIFSDALDVDHPPFAFESGMGWRELSWSECNALGMIIRPQQPGEKVNASAREAHPATPPADNFIGGQATLDRLAARLREIEATNPLSRESILAASRAANPS